MLDCSCAVAHWPYFLCTRPSCSFRVCHEVTNSWVFKGIISTLLLAPPLAESRVRMKIYPTCHHRPQYEKERNENERGRKLNRRQEAIFKMQIFTSFYHLVVAYLRERLCNYFTSTSTFLKFKVFLFFLICCDN